MTFQQEYEGALPLSKELYERAVKVFPSGVTHDSRFLEPFPTYIEKAQGVRKWDVNGFEYIDYSMGHGFLILGHRHPDVVQALHLSGAWFHFSPLPDLGTSGPDKAHLS